MKQTKWSQAYFNIKYRCENPLHPRYKYYGAKGIKCLITKEELKELFIRDNAIKLKQPSIDRINPMGNYVVENLRWIEFKENLLRKNIHGFTPEPLELFCKNNNGYSNSAKLLNISRMELYNLLHRKTKPSLQLFLRMKNNGIGVDMSKICQDPKKTYMQKKP